MQLTATQIRTLVIGVAVTLAVLFLLGILWDILWKIAGILIAIGLITMGLRFLFGKGLPKFFNRVIEQDEDKDK